MDSLQAIDPEAVLRDAPPLLAAGLQETVSARSLWAKLVYAVDESRLPSRAVASLRAFRDMIVSLADAARQDSVSIAIGKMLDQSGYLKDLRDDEQRGVERPDREPDGAGVGRARLRVARRRSLARGLCRSPVVALGNGRGIRHQDSQRVADDDARREGPGVPAGDHCRDGGRAVPALAVR